MLQNSRKALFSCMWLILSRKTVFVNISPILLLCTKRIVYNKSKFSFEFAPFRTYWEKQTFQVFLSFFFWESQFLDQNGNFSVNFPKNFSKLQKA